MRISLFYLVGPCALEFTQIKTFDQFWTDPHADELVQRHRMHSSNRTTSNSTAMMISVNTPHSPKFQPNFQMNVRRESTCIISFFLNVDL